MCTAPLQNHCAQSLYFVYTSRFQNGMNPRGRRVITFILPVLCIILGNTLGQDLAAPVQRVRSANAGRRDVNDLVDPERSSRLKDLEGATHIQVKEIVGILLATIFVDAVPGGYVDDAIAAAKIYPATLTDPEQTLG